MLSGLPCQCVSPPSCRFDIFPTPSHPARRKMLSDGAAQELKQRILRECEKFERDVRLRNQQAREKADAVVARAVRHAVIFRCILLRCMSREDFTAP